MRTTRYKYHVAVHVDIDRVMFSSFQYYTMSVGAMFCVFSIIRFHQMDAAAFQYNMMRHGMNDSYQQNDSSSPMMFAMMQTDGYPVQINDQCQSLPKMKPTQTRNEDRSNTVSAMPKTLVAKSTLDCVMLLMAVTFFSIVAL